MLEFLSQYAFGLGLGVVALLLAVFHRLVMRAFGVVLVPENHLALVNKKFVLLGEHKTLPEGQIIALKGEAGWQADTLPPGLYYGYWPWQYEIELTPFTLIPDGQLGCLSLIAGGPGEG